jgi:hypothetical protein
MPLAELVVHHSRPVAPTRRVALGESHLPTDPAPGFGGILLAGVVAAHSGSLDAEATTGLVRLTRDLEEGQRIAQPRLRYRLQQDRVGLTRSRLRLVGEGQALRFDFDDKGAPAQYCLAAVYAAGALEPGARAVVMDAVRHATRWRGGVGPELISYLRGSGQAWGSVPSGHGDPVLWALETLGIDRSGAADDPAHVQDRFRLLLRDAHPDHGGHTDDAAQRIADLAAARRILLAEA